MKLSRTTPPYPSRSRRKRGGPALQSSSETLSFRWGRGDRLTHPAPVRVRAKPSWSLLLLLAAVLIAGKAWGLAHLPPPGGSAQPEFVQLDRAALAHAPRTDGPQFVRVGDKLDPLDGPSGPGRFLASDHAGERAAVRTGVAAEPSLGAPSAQSRRGMRAREPPFRPSSS